MENPPPSPSPGPPPKQAPPPTGWPRTTQLGIGILALVMLGLWIWRASLGGSESRTSVDYSQMWSWVEAGKVKSVVIDGQTLTGTLSAAETVNGKPLTEFRTALPGGSTGDGDKLLPLLREKHVTIRAATTKSSVLGQLVIALLPWVLMVALWLWLARRGKKMLGGSGALGMLKSRSRKYERALHVAVTFDDVAGLQSAKRDLEEIVQFLKQPERFRRLGGKVPRGVLLIGPPGTGKTLLARAVAGESGVPFYSISASEFIEMFVGVGAARVRELFEEAKQHAPAIIFIDEIDAVGRSRGAGLGGGHDEREQTLNQLLFEMDGFDRNDLLVVLAATNRPDVLDSALLRPGRFDRRVLVDRPELAARVAILGVHTRGKPLARDVDLTALARTTPGFSGADLANLVNEAALTATRRGAEALAAADFMAAYDKIVLGDPREAKLDAREKARVALHESGHAVVAQFSPDAEPLQRITIIPRGMALGVTQQTPAEDRHLITRPELETRLRVLMGGLAAEKLRLGNTSTGAENDLREATQLATNMVAHYGMSDALGPVYVEHQEAHAFLGQRIATGGGASDATIHTVEVEARALLTRAAAQAGELIAAHAEALDRVVAALLDKETLERAELAVLLAEPVRPVVTGPPALVVSR